MLDNGCEQWNALTGWHRCAASALCWTVSEWAVKWNKTQLHVDSVNRLFGKQVQPLDSCVEMWISRTDPPWIQYSSIQFYLQSWKKKSHSHCFHRNKARCCKSDVPDQLIISMCEHLYNSRRFGSLLVWRIQVCVNTGLQERTSQQIHPKVRPYKAQRNYRRAKSQTLQASVCMTNVKVQDSTVIKRLNNYGCFGRAAGESLFSLKRQSPQVLHIWR